MSIKVEIKQKQLESQAPLKMHYLPAKIDGDGEADVERFFENYTKVDSKANSCEQLTNSLRGFPLHGEERLIPDGYKALVLQETHKVFNEESDRTLKVAGSFNKYYYWNYDKIPSKSDPYNQALQMVQISKELSTPFTEEEVLAEIAMNKKSWDKERKLD